MSMRAQRNRILIDLGGEPGKVNDNHTFLVKDLGKAKDKQYWVPVPGSVISMFVTGGHDWRYLGPSRSKAVLAKLKEIDEAQKHIVGEQIDVTADDFELNLSLNELGLEGGEPPKIPDALNTPIEDLVPKPTKSKGKSGDDAS